MLVREEIDGVSVFAYDSARPTLRASLIVNHGSADETLHTSGWTHLLEHLALHDWKDARMSFNASVSLIETRFDLDGEVDTVVEHLGRLTDWLREPDLDRWEHEAKVLRAEADSKPVLNYALNLDWRFGPRGPGLSAYREVGLGSADPEKLREWAATNFTRGTTALALDGPIPAGLRLALPDGPARTRRLTPDATTVRPGAYGQEGGMLVSGVVERSFAATMTATLLQRAMFDTFREGQAAAYAPWTDYQVLTKDWALLVAATDVAGGHEKESGSAWLAMLDRLIAEGMPQAYIDDFLVHLDRSLNDPANAPVEAWSAARAHIRSEPFYEPEQLREEYAAVTVDDVRAVLRTMRSTLVMGLTKGAERPDVVPWLEPVPQEVVRGRTSIYLGDARGVLRINPKRVQISGPGYRHDVAFDEVVGVVAHPDGRRHLITHQGWQLTVEPTLWSGGRKIVERIDRRVDTAAMLPQPVRPDDWIPKPASRATRVRNMLRAIPLRPWMLVPLAACLAAGYVAIRQGTYWQSFVLVSMSLSVIASALLRDYRQRPE